MINNKAKKIIRVCLIVIAVYAALSILVYLFMRSMVYERTSFGDEEMEIINQHLGITIKGSTTPVKLRVIRGQDPTYYLWLENIDDPRKFMGDCFEGTYSVYTDIWYLKGISGTDDYYDYDEDLKVDDAYIVYSCELKNDYGYNRYYKYHIAFYKDGDSFKAKVYADDR
ncbi:MAG: hypothetical protein J5582_03105 [Ruminococcus sp.]|uniref:hypothetical protein n=1 Tax=Ruminococcus sp. TaxID=41978 RepID=UPI0025DB312F|nr:hypothetical protein [Ruminococcus sp.]MBO4865548.1 hypothetical protein [Ruminococcus sp.]